MYKLSEINISKNMMTYKNLNNILSFKIERIFEKIKTPLE